MKYLRQFTIIIAVTCAGELMHHFIPLPVPASIYGLVLMLLLLCTGLVKLESVKETGSFLLSWMSLMLVAPTVSLMGAWDQLRPIVIPVVIISVVTTVMTMGATGRAAQAIIRLEGRRKK